MWKEFKAFLIKQNVLALAIAVVVGAALNDVVKSLVDGAIMPLVAAVSPDPSSYQTMEWVLGPFHFKPGLIIVALVNFLIIGFVAWRLTKLFIREAPTAPARELKTCQFCMMEDVDARASRCPHCTSPLDQAAAAAVGGFAR